MVKQHTIINRELSWLSFNERVLQEAADNNVPLIERLKFLGIFSNNLDEFFKVRVATIKRMIDLKFIQNKYTVEKPEKLLVRIQEKVLKLQQRFQQIYNELVTELEKHNIYIINEKQLNQEQEEYVVKYYEEKVKPALAPIMLKNVTSFPYLKDKSIYLITKLSRSKRKTSEYSIIEIPTAVLPRFLVLPQIGDKKFIILLDDVVRYNLKEIFSIFDYDNFEAYTIKLTRDAELDIDNDLSQSFLEKIQKGVSDRKKGQPVRFVYDQAMPKDILKFITKELDLDQYDNMIPGGRYHNFKDFMSFPNVGGSQFENSPTPSLNHPHLIHQPSIIKSILEKDILLHYPYHKFTQFINLLREASISPNVKSIQITIYRVASNSKIINALINAARNQKEVTVLIELQARFDEKSNIYWARKLEEAGAKVLFGIRGLKIHSKLLLISGAFNNKNINIAGISTGNFHEGNAAVYTDMTLLTCHKSITNEVAKVFDYFDNTYKFPTYNHLLVSPQYMRRKLENLIQKEILFARNGDPAYIILKINNLVDQGMIDKLYQASQQGVKIKLIVRGTCALMAGVPGLSENIEAISIIDKYLEHTRVLIFSNGGNETIYISSADWMTRNLDNRVEVASPIYDPQIKKEIRDVIDLQLSDNIKARILDQCQANVYLKNEIAQPIRSQIETYEYYKDRL